MTIGINEVFDLEDDEIAYINKISTEISNTKQTMTQKTQSPRTYRTTFERDNRKFTSRRYSKGHKSLKEILTRFCQR